MNLDRLLVKKKTIIFFPRLVSGRDCGLKTTPFLRYINPTSSPLEGVTRRFHGKLQLQMSPPYALDLNPICHTAG